MQKSHDKCQQASQPDRNLLGICLKHPQRFHASLCSLPATSHVGDVGLSIFGSEVSKESAIDTTAITTTVITFTKAAVTASPGGLLDWRLELHDLAAHLGGIVAGGVVEYVPEGILICCFSKLSSSPGV